MSESNDFDQPLLQLSPQEKAAYSYLFNLADTDSLGVITGERAVSFFEKTHVPAQALGEIWQIADTENRGLLTKPGFCMVVRLIGWWQNGNQTPTTDLAFKPAPIPKFDGINLPGPPQQQPAAASPTTGGFPSNALQPQLSGQSASGPIRVPPLDPAKVQQYSGLFERSGAQNGLLDGATAKSIFERAGLPNDVLGKIWMLSDRQQRGALDETEFIVAMHLLTSMKTRAMTGLPSMLPPGLYEAAARRGQRPPSRQMSAAPTPVPRQLTGTSTQPRTQSPLARPAGYGTPPPQSAQPTGPQWLVTPQDKVQYDRHFAEIDKAGRGIIGGDQAVEFFSNSNLNEDTLASIWDLADINSEGQLNRDEFAVAMYLIRQQRVQNAPPLPAFLPTALIPPSMRRQQQPPAAASSAFDAPPVIQPPAPKASDDLFGLDSSPTQSQPPQSSLQPQGTGASASRDPFGGSGPSSPSSPAKFGTPQQTGSTGFKQFVPTSAFGASLASQPTGQSTTSSQGQTRGFPAQQAPKAPMPSTMDDLLGDNEANTAESSRLTNDSTELANMSNQIGNLRTQMEATQTKKTATQAELTATSNRKRDLEQRLQQFRAQYDNEVKSVKEMEQQLTASRESTKKLGQELAMIEGSHQDLQTQHNTVSQQLQADQQENANLKQRISQLNAEISRLKPEIEKLKLDARQQKGLVSINKKQLATNEGDRDRLQSEKVDLESQAAAQAEQARSVAASPEPVMSPASNVASPAASTTTSTNPFFRKASEGASAVASPAASPPAVGSSVPTPSAFDAIFGPSTAYAPNGQAGSRTGTPPATSFIGRSVPPAAAVGAGAGAAALGATALGGAALADSVSSGGEMTPAATPPVESGPLDSTPASAAPPPPPESRQFTPTNLPIISADGDTGSDAASSTKVIPPASRAGGVETPRELASSPAPVSTSEAVFPEPTPAEADREIIPGAFPDEELQPTVSHQEVPAHSSGDPTPQGKLNDDFDSAFASFGDGEKAKEATSADDPFAPGPSQTSQSQEFPPIKSLELDDDDDDSSDSDDDAPAPTGFDDSFTTPPRNEVASNTLQPTSAAVASGDDIAAARPDFTSVESTASDLPAINKEVSPPTYEQSGNAALGGSGERSASNQFPPEFGDLLPAREDPTSPPPPDSEPQAEASISEAATNDAPALTFAAPQPQEANSLQPGYIPRETVTTPSTDIFVDASSRPMSSITEAAPDTAQTTTAAASNSKNAFDDFDDFADLSEAKEADKTGSDFDFGFGRPSVDEFNPAFDSPAPSQSQTPTPMNRSLQAPTSAATENGFANFAPNVSTSSGVGSGSGSGNGSIQQTPQNVQHDWDAIFSGLDSSKDVDTTFGSSSDPWGSSTATTNGNATTSSAVPVQPDEEVYAPPPGPPPGKAALPPLGRAITPGTEHDDPILKRLTGMGYPRHQALEALERYDYDINKAVDHLSSS